MCELLEMIGLQYEVSVIVCTYNPNWEKLKSTLFSVVSQKNIGFEIIITDDGSEEDYFERINEYLNINGVQNHLLIKHKKNVGTVNNIYGALLNASGKYTYCISPGDMFYDDNVLRNMCDFAQKKSAILCFGDFVYYRLSNDGLTVIDDLPTAPCKPEFFSEEVQVDSAMKSVLFGNNVLGAAILRKTEMALKYFELIKDDVKYAEDNTTIVNMLADGVRIYHYRNFAVWYEYGCGVSTNSNDKWNALLQKDFAASLKILKQRHPANSFIKNFVKANEITNKLLQHFYFFLCARDVYAEKRIYKRKIKRYGYNKHIDVNKLKKYLYLEDR